MFQQRYGVGLAAPEGLEHLHRVLAAAQSQDGFAEAVAHLGDLLLVFQTGQVASSVCAASLYAAEVVRAWACNRAIQD